MNYLINQKKRKKEEKDFLVTFVVFRVELNIHIIPHIGLLRIYFDHDCWQDNRNKKNRQIIKYFESQ